jgi:hypothetical protein
MTEGLVTFLGSGEAFGSGGRFQTCISVASAQTHFLCLHHLYLDLFIGKWSDALRLLTVPLSASVAERGDQ